MLAVIEKVGNEYIARYERHLKHTVEKVWSSLTENDELKKWFPELSVEDLREGGNIKFDMQDGHFEDLPITELKLYSVLEFNWWENSIRFELYPDSKGGSLLVLKEKISEITDHTPVDLAGWHVCLDVIEILLEGKTIESRKQVWQERYEDYINIIANIKN